MRHRPSRIAGGSGRRASNGGGFLGGDAAAGPGQAWRQGREISSARSEEAIAFEERGIRHGVLLPGAGSYSEPRKVLPRTETTLPAPGVCADIGDASGD